jgi:hypothetical protein
LDVPDDFARLLCHQRERAFLVADRDDDLDFFLTCKGSAFDGD